MANTHAVSSDYSENVMYFHLFAFPSTKELDSLTTIKVLAAKKLNSTQSFMKRL